MIDSPAYRRLQNHLYRLSGIICTECDLSAVGNRTACPCCGSRAVLARMFSGQGRIAAWTTVTKPPVDHLRTGPFPLALIQLAEGPRTLAKLADTLSRPPAVGSPVEVVVRRLYEPGSEDLICYAYKFRAAWPASTGEEMISM